MTIYLCLSLQVADVEALFANTGAANDNATMTTTQNAALNTFNRTSMTSSFIPVPVPAWSPVPLPR